MCRAMDMESSVPDAKAMNITLKVKSMLQVSIQNNVIIIIIKYYYLYY